MAEYDAKKASKEDIEAGLKLLAKKREYEAKVRSGEIKVKTWKDLTPEEKAKAKERDKKYQIRAKLLKEKATQAGITVSNAEVDAAYAALKRA